MEGVDLVVTPQMPVALGRRKFARFKLVRETMRLRQRELTNVYLSVAGKGTPLSYVTNA